MSREAIDDLTEEGTIVAYFSVARELREAVREQEDKGVVGGRRTSVVFVKVMRRVEVERCRIFPRSCIRVPLALPGRPLLISAL